ncbi:MAG: helix-turn-helix transcriptional regulator [Rivularia sp. (in: Bacteria)]|nr:helix-turn-helix transcriptional regulator [Rivularia sp. MS3]
MKTTQILQANHFKSESRSQIIPESPLISSQSMNLEQVQFDYYNFGDYETPKHNHIHHVITIAFENVKTERILDGVLQTENQVFSSVGIIPANIEHWCMWKNTPKFALISIHPDFLANIAYEFVNPDKVELIPTFAHQSDYFISGIAEAIGHEVANGIDSCQLHLESLFNQLSVYLLEKYATSKPQIQEYNGLAPLKLKQVLELISNCFTEEITTLELANFLNMSQYHFCREFKKSVGVTPNYYIMQQRVEMAKRILKQQKKPIAEVAIECGFSNPNHLGRVFKKHTGTTPSKYRNG